MSKNRKFSKAVCDKIGNYVYRLIDPRNGETFYVGKGTANRVFNHIEASLKFDKTNLEGEDEISTKLKLIKDIHNANLEVIHVIHRHGIPNESVYEVEAALIDAYSGLSNISSGHYSNERGPMNANQIVDNFDLEAIDWEPEHKLVLICINKFEGGNSDDLYQQLRYSWRIDTKRAEQADYILAVVQGVVIGAYVADFWKRATRKNFPHIINEASSRKAFKGKPAPKDIQHLYCGQRGKRIEIDALKHVQNPIRYWNI